MRISMLSTKDNPYNPFDKFDQWLLYDNEKGYNTCGVLATLLPYKKGKDDYEDPQAIETVIDQIVASDPRGNFIKVTKNTSE